MTRGELRARLILRLRIPPSGDPLLDEPTLNDCIQAALNDVSSYQDWPWLLTSASLTFTAGSAPLPADFVKGRELVINNNRARPSSLGEFLDNASTSDLYLWDIIGATVRLLPAPATSPTNTFYYIRIEPDLTLDTQSPLIPEAHQAAVVCKAAYLACVRRGQADAANFHGAEFESHLRRMNDATKRVNRPRTIRTTGFQRWATW